ncbi:MULTISPECIES: biotin synthase BioB [unclassified Paludibacterium]|uniref:biotin synthase BioB n=1 Tax=unclassified Paludibacterium TaxID=2618429 RepID=UPI001C058456|nr:biotin synthase BioB [Paludibacterium sp. B53371]BEV72533.1 biotin synthase BioB [Paludibacterium sp. THUN1379]
MQQSTIRFASPSQPHPQRSNWTVAEVEALYDLPLMELVFRAAEVHRQFFDPCRVQLSTLLSIKTGGCEEDCGYCPQSSHHDTPVEDQPMMTVDEVVAAARAARDNGASRFCMGAAWRGPKDADLAKTLEMVRQVKALGLETCATFGLLKDGQAEQLKGAGLDYYNHNLDTAPDKYADIIQTREYNDRLDTLGKVRQAGLSVCCGGIVGLNETRQDRAGLIAQLANLDPQPESVPVNQLVKVHGTPMEDAADLDWTEFVRTIAVARLTMPGSFVRLSAGRRSMPEAMQALCFLAGANSIFYGDKLLTTGNPDVEADRQLMQKLDLLPLELSAAAE